MQRPARVAGVVALLVCLGVLVVAAPGGAHQTAGFLSDQVITAHYEGTEDDSHSNQVLSSWKKHMEWDLWFRGTIGQLESGSGFWQITKLKGTLSATYNGVGAKTCSAKLTPVKGLRISVQGGLSPDRAFLDVNAFPPITREQLVSSTESDSACGSTAAIGGIYGGSPSDEAKVELRSGGPLSVTKRFDGSYVGRGANNAEKIRDVRLSSLTLALGKVLPAPPPGRPGTAAPTTPGTVRAAALSELVGIDNKGNRIPSKLGMALGPCLTVVAGAGFFVGGSGIFVGPLVGSAMIATASPFCLALVKSIIGLVDTYDDPPDPRYDVVAPVPLPALVQVGLPQCPTTPAASAKACSAFESHALAYVAAARCFAGVAGTLGTTVSRESAAAKAKDKTALAKQRQAALALLPKLSAASKALSAAGRALAADLRAAGVTAHLTRDQSARAIGILVHRVAVGGVPEKKLRAIAGKKLSPAPFDAVAALG